jgi:hypothetical protein
VDFAVIAAAEVGWLLPVMVATLDVDGSVICPSMADVGVS